jgi:hypothetical protein
MQLILPLLHSLHKYIKHTTLSRREWKEWRRCACTGTSSTYLITNTVRDDAPYWPVVKRGIGSATQKHRGLGLSLGALCVSAGAEEYDQKISIGEKEVNDGIEKDGLKDAIDIG